MPQPKIKHHAPGRLSASSVARLAGVHPDLVAVLRRAAEVATPPPFLVVEGLRTPLRQRQLVMAGLSHGFDSPHFHGHAVDLAPLVGGRPSSDEGVLRALAGRLQAAAAELGVPLEWGGENPRWRQPHHFQLAASAYPVSRQRA